MRSLLADLDAESDQLRDTIERLGEQGWSLPTPAQGWTVATQVAHLLWTDEVAVLAAHSSRSEPDKNAWDDVVLEAMSDPSGFVDAGALALAELPRDDVLERWSQARQALREALVS